MLRFLTSGESHGQALVAIIDGFPAGLPVDNDQINAELARRQQGYGRGARQKIETDRCEIVGGVRHGITTGAPVSLMIRNRDWDNWKHVMSLKPLDLQDPEVKEQLEKKKITRFRPGHADLPGTLKFRHSDIRDVLERASARETAARVAVGALCEQLLRRLDVKVVSHVVQVGGVASITPSGINLDELEQRVNESEMFCLDADTTELMKETVKMAWQEGDSIGGVVEVLCDGLPVGLGSYTQWDERIDGQLAQAAMSVQAIKAVEFGDGVESAGFPGSQVHDAIYPSESETADLAMGRDFVVGGQVLPFTRRTNHAGGIEGGMTNGSRLKVRAYMKPIPTLRKGLPSLSFPAFAAETAHYERSDVCAVPAASVVVKAMTSFILARAILSKFGSDSIIDIAQAVESYRRYCAAPDLPKPPKSPKPKVGAAQTNTPEMELE